MPTMAVIAKAVAWTSPNSRRKPNFVSLPAKRHPVSESNLDHKGYWVKNRRQ
jgi:hypothetical protein